MKGFNPNKRPKKRSKPNKTTTSRGKELQDLAFERQHCGDILNAEKLYRQSIECGNKNEIILTNLGAILVQYGKHQEAITLFKSAIEINPNYSPAYSNLGVSYFKLNKISQSIEAFAIAIELSHEDNRSLENLKLALKSATINNENYPSLDKAYSALLQCKDINHSEYSNLFTLLFLPQIRASYKEFDTKPLNGIHFKRLISDKRFSASLSLFITTNAEVEEFLTKARRVLLDFYTNSPCRIPKNILLFTESLASQCYLNEYLYCKSEQESEKISDIIKQLQKDKSTFNNFLAIIGCYIPIHTLKVDKHLIDQYPRTAKESQDFIKMQIEDPDKQEEIKTKLKASIRPGDQTSQDVKKMYEENPYPRYRYGNYTSPQYSKTIQEQISLEITNSTLNFPQRFSASKDPLKVLIAGCGTGSQVISASRFRNVHITAIDLSISSLAYAAMKAEEYSMTNVEFIQMDILDINSIGIRFDVIECAGVIHHMKSPEKALKLLAESLAYGGFIRLGIYSELSRTDVIKARKETSKLSTKDTEESIRSFRAKVLSGYYNELDNLTSYQDFYTLSGCRDLCFHVQEKRFTIDSLRRMLSSQNLEFCGFNVHQKTSDLYKQNFPKDEQMISLGNWAIFEEKNPQTFKSMYQLWAQKRLPMQPKTQAK